MAAPQGEAAAPSSDARYARSAFLSVFSTLPCALLLLGHYGGWFSQATHLSAQAREANEVGGANASEGPRTPPVHRVVYVKTHATGSSTLTNMFHRFCEVYRLQCFSCGAHVGGGGEIDGLTLRRQHLEEVLAKGWELDVFPNHVVFVPELFDRMIPNSVKVSSFREPKARIISMLAHYRASISSTIDKIRRGGRFACGAQTWLMSEQIALQDFHALDFVLLTEKYHLSLVMMRRRFGWRLADILYAPIKVSRKTHSERAKLMALIENPGNESIRRSVDSLFSCAADDGDEMRLYKMAQAKFQEQWDSFGVAEQPSLLEEVKLFEATLKELWGCCEHGGDPYCRELKLDDGFWRERHDPASRRRVTSAMDKYVQSQCWKKLPVEFQ